MAINHRSGSNSDFGSDTVALIRVCRGFARSKQRSLPKEKTSVSVDCIDTVVFGGDVQKIICIPSWKKQSRYNQRLGINLPIHIGYPQFAKIGAVYVARCKTPFARIQTGSGKIIMPGQNICRTKPRDWRK